MTPEHASEATLGLPHVGGDLLLSLVVLILAGAAALGMPRRDRRRSLALAALGTALLLGIAPWLPAGPAILLGSLSAGPLTAVLEVGRGRSEARISFLGTCLLLVFAGAGRILGQEGMVAVGLLLALAWRMGMFPFHAWMVGVVETAPVPAGVLLLASPVPILLMVRILSQIPGEISPVGQDVLTSLGVLGALYGSVLALTQDHLRRLAAFLAVSQGGTLLGALASHSSDGWAGAILASIGYSLPTGGLLLLSRAVEVRTGSARLGDLHGLSGKAPGLAAAFLALGFASVGFPGSLAFVGEDLMMHGLMEERPWMGTLLVLATALNTITLFQAFTTVFLGSVRPREGSRDMVDLLWRERLAVVSLLLVVLATGWLPATVVEQGYRLAGGESPPAGADE